MTVYAFLKQAAKSHSAVVGGGKAEELQERAAALDPWARIQNDNFYIEPQGKLMAMASVPRKGRVELDLSDLVIRDF